MQLEGECEICVDDFHLHPHMYQRIDPRIIAAIHEKRALLRRVEL